jgi:hypothetical protein
MQDVKFLSDKTNLLRNLLINKTPEEINAINTEKLDAAIAAHDVGAVSAAVDAVLPPNA